ncbi:MAG TPA: hypothetical protein VGG27_03200 [Magnetospirillaceae bacterium]|jgi:hypothetical protein
MTEWGRDDLRRFLNQAIESFIQTVDKRHGGAAVTAKDLREAARAIEASGALDAGVNATYRRLKDEVAKELIRNRRREPFKRLMVHPLTPALDSGAVPRDMLPNYFNFLHLVLGDETESLSRLCVTICKDERHEDGVDWDHFYADERAKFVLWTVLHRIAASFKKFDMRRDWFIGLMQNKQTAMSLGSNAFVPLPPENEPKEPRPFGANEFNALFAALYGPLRKLGLEDEAHFVEVLQDSPKKVFGDMWSNLERLGATF